MLFVAIVGFSIFTSAGSAAPRIVFLGDSLTAGYGLSPEEAYPALLAEKLEEAGMEAEVVNAGVSGDTSAGGVRRVRWVLAQPTDVLVIGLGGNDGLRGLSTEALADNLLKMIATAREIYPEIQILLAGMRMPASMGETYQRNFAAVFQQVAEDTGVRLIPFLLEGVAGDPGLNQPDGIHPNSTGQQRIAETVWPHLKSMLGNR